MVGPRACRNPFFLASKDKFAKQTPTKRSGIATPTSTAFKAPTFATTLILGLLGRNTDNYLQKVTKLAPELFVWGQKHGQLQANSTPYNNLLKLKNSNLYYKYLYIECYYFCCQCKYYFKIVGVTRPKYVFFTTLFLHNKVNF